MEEQKRYEPTRPVIYEKITLIAQGIGAITKNKKNTSQNFMFRGIDDVYNAIQPLLAKHSVFTIPEVIEDRTEERQSKSGGTLIYRILKMKYTFFTTDGSSVCATVIGEGMDSGDKAANKAMAIAHKYALLQTFCVPTEDMKDPDAESHEVADGFINEKQLSQITDIINTKGVDEDAFLKYMKTESTNKIFTKDFNKAMSALKKAKGRTRQPGEEG